MPLTATQILRRPVLRLHSLLVKSSTRPSCRVHTEKGRSLPSATSRRRLSTKYADKPYYITTPIFYVNAAPHVGHFYTMVLADILKRYQTLRGRPAVLCTGTDEHGLKVQQASLRAQADPKEFCDVGAEIFQRLARTANIDNDHFVRTTDDDHKEAVQYAWRVLKDRGYIYEKKHEGWYCISDETFYPETSIEKRRDPFDGRIFMASRETGKEVEWTSETNYHFRLSAFRQQLLDHYATNPGFVVPAARMNDVIQAVTTSLEDLSISRPSSRLTWGIPVPEDESQTIYVWLDALLNYASKVGYPFRSPETAHLGGWPADVQVIGKDIVRFHCIYWPAFLLALGLPLPKQILTHAHWTLGRQKMAKSTGNVVNPFFAMERFGTDVMRFYLAHDGGIANDSDYGNNHIVERYKKSLQGGLGNLLSRVTRSKLWSVRDAVRTVTRGRHQPQTEIDQDQLSERVAKDVRFEREIAALPAIYEKAFEALNPSDALKAIMELVYSANRYLHTAEPWSLTRLPETRARTDRIHRVVFNAAEAVRMAGILLQPFMPLKSGELLEELGVGKRGWEMVGYGADSSYGYERGNLGKKAYNSAWDGLFPRLPVEK